MYHSALKGFKEFSEEKIVAIGKNIHASIFNVENDSVPDHFKKADFIYADLPYKNGYETFNKRANKSGKGYSYFVQKVLNVTKEIGKPFYLIGEKHISEYKGLNKCEIYYTPHKCTTYCYSNMEMPNVKTTNELLDYLFKKNSIGLDFLCGYGTTGRFAIKHNKFAILADYNPKCIGYIYENLL